MLEFNHSDSSLLAFNDKMVVIEQKIYCVGDSHVCFFSGQDKIQPPWPEVADDRLPCFRSYRLGPILAYNLPRVGASNRGREKLFDLCQFHMPAGSNVLLCFGEIDCRVHLQKQSLLQRRILDDVVAECVERYISVALELRNLGFNIMIYNVIPSSLFDDLECEEYPAFGSCLQRNEVTRLFNRELNRRCDKNDMLFVSTFDSLIDGTGSTDMSYYMDKVHLSQKAMPMTIKAIVALLQRKAIQNSTQ